MGIFLRHRLLIAGCILFAGAVGWAYVWRTRPLYDATALIRFDAERVDLPQLVQALPTANLISTEIEVLRGRATAAAIVDSLGLRSQLLVPRRGRATALFSTVQVHEAADTSTLLITPRSDGTFTIGRAESTAELAVARVGDTTRIAGVMLVLAPAALSERDIRLRIDSRDATIRRIRSAVIVTRPLHDADLIAIHFRSGDPDHAAAVANLLARNLLADRQAARHSRTSSAVHFLELQYDSLSRELHAAEDSLRAYQLREQVIDVPQQASAEVARLAKLQADLAAVRAERDAFASLVAGLRGDTNDGLSRRLMAFPTLLNNQSTAVLLGSLAEAERERSQLLIRRTPADSDVQVLTHRIRDIEGQLQGIAESYLQGLSNQVDALEGEASRFRTQLDALPEKELQTARRERDTRALRELSGLVRNRLGEAQLAGAGGAWAARIVDEATPPLNPFKPRPRITMALSLLLGGLLGGMAAFARDHSDRSVRSRADALSAAGLPVLGAFPRLRLVRSSRRLRAGRGNVRVGSPDGAGLVTPSTGDGDNERARTIAALRSLLVTRSAASAAYIESLNQLFATLTLGYREQPLKVVVFTSPLPGEGKTLSAINFALVGASRGLRVLLIDADLRCGVVSSVLGCRRDPGFAELLDGTSPPGDAVRQISLGEHESLTVLPSGVLPMVPGRVLTLERIQEVLATLTPQYDFVVIDTPPVNLLADAALLGSAADGVLLVVRAGHTQVDDLSYAMDQLEAAGAPVLGTLLNDIDLRRNSRDDGAYRYLAEAGRYSATAS